MFINSFKFNNPSIRNKNNVETRQLTGFSQRSGFSDDNKAVISHPVPVIPFKGQIFLADDNEYRKSIALGVGCEPKHLKAVIGPNELKKRIDNAKPENFDPANAEKGLYNINLHLHTTASDGEFTPETLFNEVDKQVQNIKKNDKNDSFVVAISDHDTMEGVKDALKYIAEETKKNPDRFKNIRFAPGIEFFGKYENPEFLKKRVEFEMIGYCINPYGKEFKDFEEANKRKNNGVIDDIIRKTQEEYGIDTSDFKKYRKNDEYLKVPSGVALKNSLDRYLKTKELTRKQRQEILKEKFPASITNISEIIKASKGAMVGIAHPIRIKIGPCLKDENLSETDALLRLFKEFKSCGGHAAEGNYQLAKVHSKRVKILPEKESMAEKATLIANLCDEAGLLKTGGIDNHGTTLLEFDKKES